MVASILFYRHGFVGVEIHEPKKYPLGDDRGLGNVLGA
jgi:hypothetical protein